MEVVNVVPYEGIAFPATLFARSKSLGVIIPIELLRYTGLVNETFVEIRLLPNGLSVKRIKRCRKGNYTLGIKVIDTLKDTVFLRKVAQIGNSGGIYIPGPIVQHFGFKNREQVKMRAVNDTLFFERGSNDEDGDDKDGSSTTL